MTEPPTMTSGSVRPFAAWLVRADAAADEVAAMAETAVAARSGPRPVHPEAFDPMPEAVYVYRQRTANADHVGIVCDLAPEVFVAGRVLRHEEVQPDRVDALARYLESVPQRVELVSTMHHAGPVAEQVVAEALASPPLLDVPGADGTRQTVWRVPPGARTDALCRELETGLHYIADGHHRVAAALEVWEHSGRAPGHGVLCAVYSLGGLRLDSFDRWVHGPVDAELLLDLLRRAFAVRPATDADDAARDGSAVYVGGRWYGARFTGERPPGSAGLDVSLLHALVLDHLPPQTRVEPVRELTEVLVTACDANGGALLVPPAPALEVVTAIADAGEVVPAKSTFFAPKPASGVFLRAPRDVATVGTA
ncbi:DUF1015 family protein [Phycicoccus flavus]|uniref:DUF1015 domain-containing protein n=1 Tax=Phycicoccus flavus TaxID=2502783 RepID=A0A8T6R7Z4_9MICO|nr:DUF1015 family protein [Phycicoccus flavus]NHA68341.1 DUF1015 domain-containing protein [Phycicoccus flavus]